MAQGSCGVTTACTDAASCFGKECYIVACQGLGVGPEKCFLDPLFNTVCSTVDKAGCESLWSSTAATNTPRGESQAYRLDFSSAVLACVLTTSDASTRCVRGP